MLLTIVFNIIGVFLTVLIASQISSGKSVSFEDGIAFNISLYNLGLILWVVLLVVYLWGTKMLWGKTAGGLVVDLIMGKKKGKR
ncbi:hypothetical protein HY404_03860 [Candidatus Microgenomates bacterium]|nr:hypothetical protein [Candidatus Microgenomates bacterium]